MDVLIYLLRRVPLFISSKENLFALLILYLLNPYLQKISLTFSIGISLSLLFLLLLILNFNAFITCRIKVLLWDHSSITYIWDLLFFSFYLQHYPPPHFYLHLKYLLALLSHFLIWNGLGIELNPPSWVSCSTVSSIPFLQSLTTISKLTIVSTFLSLSSLFFKQLGQFLPVFSCPINTALYMPSNTGPSSPPAMELLMQFGVHSATHHSIT